MLLLSKSDVIFNFDFYALSMNSLETLIVFKLASCYHHCIVDLYDNDVNLDMIFLLRLVMLNSISKCRTHLCIGHIAQFGIIDDECYSCRLSIQYMLERFRALVSEFAHYIFYPMSNLCRIDRHTANLREYKTCTEVKQILQVFTCQS